MDILLKYQTENVLAHANIWPLMLQVAVELLKNGTELVADSENHLLSILHYPLNETLTRYNSIFHEWFMSVLYLNLTLQSNFWHTTTAATEQHIRYSEKDDLIFDEVWMLN